MHKPEPKVDSGLFRAAAVLKREPYSFVRSSCITLILLGWVGHARALITHAQHMLPPSIFPNGVSFSSFDLQLCYLHQLTALLRVSSTVSQAERAK